MSRLLLPIALLAAALALAACGGGGGDSTSSGDSTSGGGEALTKSEWIAAADEICAEEQEEEKPLEAELEEVSGESESEEFEAVADLSRELLGLVEGETAAIRELEPPAGDEQTIDAMLTSVEGQVPLGEEFADAIEGGEAKEIESLTEELEANSEEAKQMAEDYGLKVCGTESGE